MSTQKLAYFVLSVFCKGCGSNACKTEWGREETNELPGGMALALERNRLPDRHDIPLYLLTLEENRSQLLVGLGPRELSAPRSR